MSGETAMHDSLSPRSEWEVLKKDGRIGVYRGTVANKQPVVIKEYQLKSWQDRFSFWRKKRAVQRLYKALSGEATGFLPPLVSVERQGDLGRFCYGFIVGRDLRHLDWQRLSEEESAQISQAAAQLLISLHAAGRVHGDFKFGNLLFADDAKLYLLDVEAVKASASPKRQARDLARFLLNGLEIGIPSSALQDFWRVYLEGRWRDNGSSSSAAFTRAVEHWLQTLARRHQERYGRSVDLQNLNFLS